MDKADNKRERWKKVEGEFYKGTVYEVSDQGNARLVKPLKPTTSMSKVPRISIRDADGKLKHVRLDTTVMKAFGKEQSSSVPIHKNGDYLDNRLANLK